MQAEGRKRKGERLRSGPQLQAAKDGELSAPFVVALQVANAQANSYAQGLTGKVRRQCLELGYSLG